MKNLAVALLVCLFGAFSKSSYSQLLPLQEAHEDTIGYKTVDEALAALRAKPGVEISIQQGWTIVGDKEAQTFWSFPPKENPAFPSAVKRTITEHDGQLFIQMGVLCQASKLACDQLVVQFNQLNDRLRESMRNKP